MFTMDTMEAPQPGTPGKDGEDEPSHNKLEDMIKELGTALTGNYTCILGGYAIDNRRKKDMFLSPSNADIQICT